MPLCVVSLTVHCLLSFHFIPYFPVIGHINAVKYVPGDPATTIAGEPDRFDLNAAG